MWFLAVTDESGYQSVTMVALRKSKVPPPPELCPLRECLAVIGGAWTPNILWYLGQGARTFSELKSDIGGISAKVLSTRLKRLVAEGVLDRRVQPTSPPTVEYSLTTFGSELLPAIEAIVAVGHRIKVFKRHDRPKTKH
jgi:DNA-binding HxlR family transcriptional regulator